MGSTTTRTIEPYTAFLSEDGGGYVVADDRNQAARIVRDSERSLSGEFVPLSAYTVRRCWLRPAVSGDWVLDEYEGGVMVCEADHPEAVKGWSVLP